MYGTEGKERGEGMRETRGQKRVRERRGGRAAGSRSSRRSLKHQFESTYSYLRLVTQPLHPRIPDRGWREGKERSRTGSSRFEIPVRVGAFDK